MRYIVLYVISYVVGNTVQPWFSNVQVIANARGGNIHVACRSVCDQDQEF